MWKGLGLLAATDIGSRVRAKISALTLYGAAGLVAFVGVIFALIALLIWLSRLLTPLSAALAIAGVLLAVAVALALAARFQKPPRTQTSPLAGAALLAAPSAFTAVSKRVSFTTIAAVAAVALGALVGRRISRDG